ARDSALLRSRTRLLQVERERLPRLCTALCRGKCGARGARRGRDAGARARARAVGPLRRGGGGLSRVALARRAAASRPRVWRGVAPRPWSRDGRRGDALARASLPARGALRARPARRARPRLSHRPHAAYPADDGGHGSLLHRDPGRDGGRAARPPDPLPDVAAALSAAAFTHALVVDPDERDADPLRRPAEVEADAHALAQPVDSRDGTDDLHEGELEAVLPARGLAAQRATLAAVVDAVDDASVIAIETGGRRGRLVPFRLVAAHAGGAPPAPSPALATTCRRGVPTRSTNAAKLSPSCRSRS